MKKAMKKTIRKRMMSLVMCLAMLITTLLCVPVKHVQAASYLNLSGEAHVQNYGDVKAKVVYENGIQTLVLGTRGESKRIERAKINLDNRTGISGRLEYRVHIQKLGWTGWIPAGQAAGTEGMSYRLEGIQIRLTGDLAKYYDVRYCAHIQNYGDKQGWVYNGALAGTTGESKRLEEIKVQVVPKNSINQTPSVSYRVHRQSYGWEGKWAKDGEVSGTTGESKRLEGITITVNDNMYGGGIEYSTHVQNYGWMDKVSDGWMSGTQGESKRLEAIKINLTGDLKNHYDVYYRVHAQNEGWMGWAKNGQMAGTEGGSKRLEAIQIVLKAKNEAAPGNTYKNVSANVTYNFRNYNTGQKVYQTSSNPTPSNPTPSNPTPSNPTPSNPTPSNPTPSNPGSQWVNGYNRAYADEVLRLTNIERAKLNLPALTMSEDMYRLAYIRGEEISRKFSHDRPDGRPCFTVAKDNGIYYWSAAENIAAGYTTPQSVMDGWMNSSGHRENIQRDSVNEVGIACYKGSDGRLYWVQFFVNRR